MKIKLYMTKYHASRPKLPDPSQDKMGEIVNKINNTLNYFNTLPIRHS